MRESARRIAVMTLLVWVAAAGCREPIERRDFLVRNSDVTLGGTLVRRPGTDRRPAVLLIHGSGADGRQNAYYWMLADAFTRRGFVVLIYDKRGSGSSTGDWRRSSFSALFNDAAVMSRVLRLHPWVDSSRVGVWGGSEGGAIAPEVARRERLAFVIMQSAPAVTNAEQNLYQTELQARAMTDSPEERVSAMRLQLLKHAYARTRNGWAEYAEAVEAARGTPYAALANPSSRDDWWWAWYRTKMDYSPIPALARVRAPVLAVWGEHDVLIPVQRSRAAVAAARPRAAYYPGDSLVVVSGADHSLLINGLRGVLTRGPRNRPVHFGLITDWAARQVGGNN